MLLGVAMGKCNEILQRAALFEGKEKEEETFRAADSFKHTLHPIILIS